MIFHLTHSPVTDSNKIVEIQLGILANLRVDGYCISRENALQQISWDLTDD